MNKNENTPIYLEYAKKYEQYGISSKRLEYVENVAKKRYNSDCGMDFEMFIRIYLYFDIQSNLCDKIEQFPQVNQYKAIVIKHSQNIIKYISKDEIDIIFDDTLEEAKKNYSKTESLGSYIVRNYRNNLVKYVNQIVYTNYSELSEEDCKIKLLK